MNIKASAKFDKKTCREMVYAIYPNRAFEIAAPTIISAILLIFAAFLFFKSERIFAVPLLLAWAVACGIAFMFIKLPSIQYSSMGNSKDAVVNYVFADSEFNCEMVYSDGRIMTTSSIKYDMIYKIIESSEYIFMFQNKRSMYVIEKSTINPTELDELIAFLKKQCPIKYSTIKR